MKKLIPNLLIALGLVIPVILVFRSFWGGSHLVFGDAPFFTMQGLTDLFNEPSAWTERGNALGGPNLVLWLSPLMFIYGVLGKIFNNDVIIRILFYIPSLLLSLTGPYFLVRQLKLNKTAAFFASLFYVLNTYFLLLIDGGQVGIAVAYGLAPWVICFYLRNNFAVKVLSSAILISVDPRIFAIVYLLYLLWLLLEGKFKAILTQFFVLLILIPLNLYWIYPTFKMGVSAISASPTSLQLLSLLNGLLLYQPNWPQNLYGVITYPPFYYCLVPVLIFANLFVKDNKKIFPLLGIFLIFVFLLKGSTPPLGNYYEWLVNNISLASAFRDSSKFFLPLMLIGGILIGNLISRIRWLAIPVYLYLIFLILPALLGQLNWNLSTSHQLANVNSVNQTISKDNLLPYFRTLWFYEKPNLAFESKDKPALDAKTLMNFRPFYSLNVGGDPLNFIYQGNYQDWFNLLGIKYMNFTGDPRNLVMNKEQQADWLRLTNFISQQKTLSDSPQPLIFGVNKLVVVVGSDDIYGKLAKSVPGFLLSNQAFIFTEDGKTDVNLISNYPKDSLLVVYNGKTETDLQLGLLQKYFKGADQAKSSEWKYWPAGDYQNWKYQMLLGGIKSQEFDYAKGFATSTIASEKIYYSLNIPTDGNYVLAARIMTASDSAGIKINDQVFKPKEDSKFEWYISKTEHLTRGAAPVVLTNLGGLTVVNTVALIPENDFNLAGKNASSLTSTFSTFNINDKRLVNVLMELTPQKVDYTPGFMQGYNLPVTPKVNWLIFNQSYNSLWNLQKSTTYYSPLPFYSMLNGFYLDSNWTSLHIVFRGQEYVRWGIYFSIVSYLIGAIIWLYIYANERHHH